MAKTLTRVKDEGKPGVVRRIVPDAPDTEETAPETEAESRPEGSSPSDKNPALPFAGQISIETPVDASAVSNATYGEADLVTVVMLRDINSPPTIGSFRFLDYGITQLLAGQRVKIPYGVAIVLIDRQAASLVAS